MSLDKCPTCGTGIFTYNNINACLCSHIAEAEVATEDRIIKLLESKLCWCVGQPLNEENGREELMKHMNCDWEAMMIEYHVALIKGENK